MVAIDIEQEIKKDIINELQSKIEEESLDINNIAKRLQINIDLLNDWFSFVSLPNSDELVNIEHFIEHGNKKHKQHKHSKQNNIERGYSIIHRLIGLVDNVNNRKKPDLHIAKELGEMTGISYHTIRSWIDYTKRPNKKSIKRLQKVLLKYKLPIEDDRRLMLNTLWDIKREYNLTFKDLEKLTEIPDSSLIEYYSTDRLPQYQHVIDKLYDFIQNPPAIQYREDCRHYKGTPVLQFDRNNEIVAEYRSIKEASEKTGLTKNTIINWCKNKVSRSLTGYTFAYKEDIN